MRSRYSRRFFAALAGLSLVACCSAHAGLPMQPTRTLEFETSEGTWMSVSVAPDGSTLVFDLLGDLYLVDSQGGEAQRITGGMAFDSQPVFSPDGRHIAFVSDRSGAENLWIAGADGSAPRQITDNGSVRMYLAPSWSADGARVFATVFRADLAAYELWAIDTDGGGGELLLPVKAEPQASRDSWTSSVGAAASPDGAWLYFGRLTGHPDADIPPWTINRLSLEDGHIEPVIESPDRRAGRQAPYSYFHPLLSPDGSSLVYASRHHGQTGLRLRDLSNGRDRWLAFPVQHDQASATHVQGIMPGFAFMPDGRSLVLSVDDRLFRLNIEDGGFSPIPFTADVSIGLGPDLRIPVAEDTGPVQARLIQAPALSPDGKRLAFSALGEIFVLDLDGDAPPAALVDLPLGQYQPAWSPDGHSLAFITWTAAEGGQVWLQGAEAGATPNRLTTVADYYTHPVFSPDGRSIFALRSRQQDRMGQYMEYGDTRKAALVRIPLAGGEMRQIVEGQLGGPPHFTRESGEVFLPSSDGLIAVDPDTGEKRLAASAEGYGWYFNEGPGSITELMISPDGRWILAKDAAQQLHIFAVPDDPDEAVDLRVSGERHRQLSEVGADFFAWAPDSRSVYWAIGSTWIRCPLDFASSTETAAPACRERDPREVSVQFARDIPEGYLVLRGGTVLTMNGDEVIEDADVHIQGGHIVAVGPRGHLEPPAGAEILSVAGKVLVPGFIDDHNHISDIRRGVLDLQAWGPAADLAWGVTTAFDPSSLSIDMFAYQDLVDSGRMIGSRIRTTGPAIFSFHHFQSPESIEPVIRRYRDYYRTRNLKMYRSGDREVRQWFATACARMGMMPTTEGALAMKLGLTQVIDGYAGLEHELAAVPLGKDIIELMVGSGVSYNPTLNISAGPDAKDYFIARDDPANDPKVNRFWPGFAIDGRLRMTEWRTLSEYSFPAAAREAGWILRAGGTVGVGSHGDIPGLGPHWEMQALALGGLEPMEVLRSGTILSARAIGREAAFGSIEAGKYADLVVLDRDPRDDIANTQTISLVMKNGRLYDASTLDEIWPRRRPFPRPWFRRESAPETSPLEPQREDMTP